MAQKKYTNLALLKDLGRFIRPHRGQFILGAIIRICSDIVWLYPAIAISQLVNRLTENPVFDPWYIFQVLGIWALCSFVHYVGRDFAKYQIYQVGEKAGTDASYKTLQHMISLDIDWQERENSGNKLKRIMHGYEGFNNLIRLFVDLVCESSVNAIFVLIILATFDPIISLGMATYILCYYLISLVLLKKARAQSHIVNVQQEEVQGQYFEIINNIRTVKWMGIENSLLTEFKTLLSKLIDEMTLNIKYFRFRSGVLGLFNEIFRLSLLTYIAYGISQGNFAVGLLVIFFDYFVKIQTSSDELAWVTSEFIINKIRINRMMDILQEEPTVELSGTKRFPENWRSIQIKNLNFSYGNQKYLDDLNLTIHRGEKIGVVGLSGAGKTTLFKLLLDLYEDYEGEILFDSVSLKEIKRKSYLEHTAVVLQETEVFNLSLADNITVSGEGKDKKRLEQALKVAHINEFLPKLPEGVDTLIGEKGVKLSGGEKQRVGIARAVYRNPELLFMDEATSHLDVDSEQMIQDSLHKFFKGITAIVIAHRLSTIKEMDRIIVMHEGKIAEEGSFDELIKKKGQFARLWEKQLKKG